LRTSFPVELKSFTVPALGAGRTGVQHPRIQSPNHAPRSPGRCCEAACRRPRRISCWWFHLASRTGTLRTTLLEILDAALRKQHCRAPAAISIRDIDGSVWQMKVVLCARDVLRARFPVADRGCLPRNFPPWESVCCICIGQDDRNQRISCAGIVMKASANT
jgi:hypothetical protein